MNRRLFTAFNTLDVTKKNKDIYIPGILGFTINGDNVVDVPNRMGYVYVRLHSNLNEVVQVFNDKVSPVYGLPVLVIRDDIDTTRYRIYGRDTGAYENWQTSSAYIPRHGDQHSFGSGDITWVYDQQLVPLLVYPSGTYGAGTVMIAPDYIWHNSDWMSVGGTGTASLFPYKPTGTSASLVLVSIDAYGNPKLTAGTFPAVGITGGAALLPYLPDPAMTDIPLAMVRLVSGTSSIGWENIYDLRSFANDLTAASTGTASAVTTFESQQWVGGALGVSTYVAYYVATQTSTLKKVSLWYYDGEATDTPNHTDWTVRLNGGVIDTFTLNGTGNTILETRPFTQALVAGDYVAARTATHVAPSACDLMVIFEVEV
jgi:hypothetical protein